MHTASIKSIEGLLVTFIPMPAMGLDFNPSMQQLGQNVLPVFDSLVFF